MDDMECLKANVDEWVKQVRSEVSSLNRLPEIVSENFENTEHNYQLINELKNEMDSLRKEIVELKILQLLALKRETIR